jgi:CubicO group peptidase (beta-lactamase class C family)
MPKSRLHTVLIVVAIPVVAVPIFVTGLFVYMTATARPIHPDPKSTPSVMRSTTPPKWRDAVAQGQQIVRTALTDQNLPGVSAAVAIGAGVVWAEGFGYADLDKKVNVTPETRFRAGNVSNALTSAGVGLLLEEHRINLDADIQIYVPEFPEKQWPVTLRQLMGQVAGVRSDAGDEEPLLERCDRTVDGLRRFANDRLRFEPGTKFRTSSYGWILVSAAVEAASKEPFFTFMRTRIFDPLGMVSTRPDAWKEPIPDRATFYFPKFAGDNRYGPELAREGDHSCFAGAGAFLSTPSDLVRFGIGLNSGRLLRPDTIEVLQTPQRLTSGEETGYGLGWSLETVSLSGVSTRMAGHGTKRDVIGGTAYLMVLPERAMVVAVMSNVSFADMKSIAMKIAEAFAGGEKNPVGN